MGYNYVMSTPTPEAQIVFYPISGPFSLPVLSVSAVSEYSDIEVAVSYSGPPISLVYLYVGGAYFDGPFDLQANPLPFRFRYNVDDYVGVLRWELRQQATPIAAAELAVQPRKLSNADVAFIKERRIPTLLAQLAARNAIRLRYDDDCERLYHFYSLDYSIERLLHFSARLLDSTAGVASIAERIYNRLAYHSEAEQLHAVGDIRGAVRWAATTTRWANRPADVGLAHECRREIKDYATTLNLILVTLHRNLAQQLHALAHQLARRDPLSPIIAKMQTYAHRHDVWLERRLLAALATLPPRPISLQAAARELSYNTNPAYRELLRLWRDFHTRYVSLDPAAHLSGLQPMHKIYELWCVCEVAAALGLRETASGFGRGAIFAGRYQGQPTTLYYDQPTTAGWLSSRRGVNIRPDILLEVGGRRLLLDAKYRLGDERARTDDLLKMLAYMNDLRVPVGGIIYPGSGSLVAQPDPASNQVAYELPLRPNLDDPAALTTTLRGWLDQMIAAALCNPT